MKRLVRVLTLVCLAGVIGCDDTVFDPFSNDSRYFTVWGYLNEREGHHRIRVIPITRQVAPILSPTAHNATLDAVVRTIDLETGQTVQWVHSLEQLEDETWGHVFRTAFFVEAGHRYRLEIERNDGVKATAETTIPFQSSTRAIPQAPIVIGDSIYQDIVIPEMLSPWRINMAYSLDPTIIIPYERSGEPDGNGGWRFRVNITKDTDEIRFQTGIATSAQDIESMGVRIQMLDNQWLAPGAAFDPLTLEQSGGATNVENGYGFFGSIGPFLDDWAFSRELADLLGYPSDP